MIGLLLALLYQPYSPVFRCSPSTILVQLLKGKGKRKILWLQQDGATPLSSDLLVHARRWFIPVPGLQPAVVMTLNHTFTRPGLNRSLSSAPKCSCCFICVSAYKYCKAKKIRKPLNADKLSHLERNLCSRNLNKSLCKVFVIQPLLNSYARKSDYFLKICFYSL